MAHAVVRVVERCENAQDNESLGNKLLELTYKCIKHK